tara:strand:- start:117 stop:788 length:672 start_codon:yes stop_codon:yes gene_type:complete
MDIYSKSTKIRSIGLLYLISKLTFWFSISFSLVISSILFYGISGNDIPLTVSVEANASIYQRNYSFNDENVVIKRNKMAKEFPIQSLKRKLILKNKAFNQAPVTEQLTIFFSTLLLLIIIIFTSYYAKEFMKAINKGIYFERATIDKLRVISYLLLLAWAISFISSSLLKFMWLKTDINPVAKIHLSTNFFSINLLVFWLMLWVLSYVFLQGVGLKEENELTV